MDRKKLNIVLFSALGALIIGGGIGVFVWYRNQDDTPVELDDTSDASGADTSDDSGGDDAEDDGDDFVEPNLFQISGASSTRTSSGEVCTYTISYPQMMGTGETTIHSTVNDYFESEFVPTDEVVQLCEDGNTEVAGFSYTETVTYEVKLNDYPLVSICKDTVSYTAEAAHPATYKDCYTMDVSTGDLYGLDDLLSDGYVDALGAEVEDVLEADLGEGWLFEGFPGIDDGHNYYLTRENLVVFYDAYTVAPGAAGVPEAPIPYSDASVADYVGSGSPIAGY